MLSKFNLHMYQKRRGHLLLSSPSYFSCPNQFWFNCISEVLQKSWYIKTQRLCWIESSGIRVCGGHCAQEQSLLCILQGHGRVCLLCCHTSVYFWRTVWMWVRKSSYFWAASLKQLWCAGLSLTPAGRLIVLIVPQPPAKDLNWLHFQKWNLVCLLRT